MGSFSSLVIRGSETTGVPMAIPLDLARDAFFFGEGISNPLTLSTVGSYDVPKGCGVDVGSATALLMQLLLPPRPNPPAWPNIIPNSIFSIYCLRDARTSQLLRRLLSNIATKNCQTRDVMFNFYFTIPRLENSTPAAKSSCISPLSVLPPGL